MNFDCDAFISYAHLDNVALVEGRKGWIAGLHRALEVRVGQLLGKSADIWRDPKLAGNDLFSDAIIDRLRRVAGLISVLTPRYVRSEWTRKELSEFCRMAAQQGGIRIHEKARLFKVLKTPVPLDAHPPELQGLLGYEFFKVDPETGKVLELDEIFGPEAQRDFWLKLDDLAHDICRLLETIGSDEESTTAPMEERGAVYLAQTTSDLVNERDSIKRDLQQHGYKVLPDDPLPLVTSEVKDAVRNNLCRCRLSIHVIGRSYGIVPEGGEESLIEIQNELAIERGERGDFSRLVWIPPALRIDDERQRALMERLRTDPRLHKNADLMESPLEDLRTVYQERLRGPVGTVATAYRSNDLVRLYLIHDGRDAADAAPWAEFLFEQGFEVTRPIFEGDEGEIREYHRENLSDCDAALILYGAGSECWLRRQLRELQKSAGYGRTKPAPFVGISLLPPKTTVKEQFRTHEAVVIPQFDGFTADPLRPFAARLKR
ncbi:MAG: hypothetical protein QOF63_1546 [Thermoanaerobaculia bacterium]|nr:hypothetical protein [Thermoanaerobaculia bacterium]